MTPDVINTFFFPSTILLKWKRLIGLWDAGQTQASNQVCSVAGALLLDNGATVDVFSPVAKHLTTPQHK